MPNHKIVTVSMPREHWRILRDLAEEQITSGRVSVGEIIRGLVRDAVADRTEPPREGEGQK